MTEHLYLCPECEEHLFAFTQTAHDENLSIPCPCGSDLNLWEEKADVRVDAWDPEDYGVTNAFLLEQDKKSVTKDEAAELANW